MPATKGLLTNFKIRNSTEFVEFAKSEFSNLYIFIGKSTEWPDEEQIPGIVNSSKEELDVWNDIDGIKKIQEGDVNLGIRRIDWAPNVIFDEYDDNIDLSNKNFYVVTDQNNVYKCISNANNSVSTVKPTHVSFEEISFEADGYKWKYMFSVPDSIVNKFIVPGFYPIVEDPTVIENAKPGTIDNIKIVSKGVGYTPAAQVSSNTEIPVFIEGDGDQNSSAEIQITASEGQIVGTNITTGGSNYPIGESRLPVAIRQRTNNGTVQTAYGIASTTLQGSIASINIIKQGEQYVNGTGNIVLSSTRAYAETNSEGEIINADIFTGKQGLNFKKARAVIVDETEVQEAILEPIISPLLGHGFDPFKELFANFAMINLRLSGEESFIDENEFRRIGLIEDPIKFGKLNEEESDGQPIFFNDSIGDVKYRIVLDSDVSLFQDGEIIYGETSGTQGTEVVSFNENTLRTTIDNSIQGNTEFVIGETIRGLTTNNVASIIDIIPPDIEPYYGTILFINNREAITRDVDLQVETITFVAEY